MKPSRAEKSIVFYNANNCQLFGVIHYPSGTDKRTGFLYCHPFGEERNLSHRVSLKAAQTISGLGYPVMRFDLSGCGDSDGELNEFTIDDWLADISAAEIYFKNLFNLEQCVLWGLRFGAYLALHHAATRSANNNLILWEPIFDPKTYFQQFMKYKLSSQLIAGKSQNYDLTSPIERLQNDGLINVMGYPISRKLYESFLKKRTIDKDIIRNKQVLVLSISLMDAASPLILTYMDRLNVYCNHITFKHIKEEPFWNRPWRYFSPTTEEVSVDWIIKHL